jgi:MYXO-CTERM domain-containing protein
MRENWAESHAMASSDPLSTRAQWLWTLLGLALLGGFLAFVVDDFPLRSLITTR